ncbi:MAG: DNA-directed RNA polymerase subunit A', partial [Candidatus Diapherotrites archaeon CG_4_10_14_0_2_um_filter_31_5]
MLMKKIGGIEFNVMSPELIRKLSALDVKTPDTYDKDGYPMEGGLMDPHLGVINPGLRCKTCGQKMKQCPGHFGTLELVRPVVHSEFGRKVEELLIATCDACGRIAVPEEKLKKWREIDDPTEIKVKRILLRTKKTKKCPHCGTAKKEIMLDKPTNFYLNKERIYPTQIREWLEKIPDQDLVLFGYNTEKIRPEWFVLTVLLIPPITMRPSITLESGIKSEDDLTHKLVDIIRINLRLKDNIDAGAPQLIIEDLWDLLQYHTTTFYDNNTSGVPPAKHRSGRALRTLVQRLKGKKGRFRYNLTGKRVNHAARSTITP